MSYYDHATYMAFKLEKYAKERTLRNFELEAKIGKQKESIKRPKLLLKFYKKLCVNIF